MTPPTRRVRLPGGEVEVAEAAGEPGRAPLVWLHEGLGSLSTWKGVPWAVAERTGRRTVVWSRLGYGRSDPAPLPRPPDYLEQEATGPLPELLDALGVGAPVLVGHSDGASIALIHAASGRPVGGVVAIAPHVVVEERSIAGIEAARDRSDELIGRLGRHHDDPAAAFWGWNDVWLSAAFRPWDVTGLLPRVTSPVLAIQAADDAYGTLRQLDLVEAGVAGPVERLVVPDGGHLLPSTRPDLVVDAVARWVGRLP